MYVIYAMQGKRCIVRFVRSYKYGYAVATGIDGDFVIADAGIAGGNKEDVVFVEERLVPTEPCPSSEEAD